jgi:hypothetical protein
MSPDLPPVNRIPVKNPIQTPRFVNRFFPALPVVSELSLLFAWNTHGIHVHSDFGALSAESLSPTRQEERKTSEA